jgi:patatin-like phospholipase/acyl hydrolase
MRILSIDGGGYLGLASAALLAEFERHFRASCHDSFDLFCGTSTGAIIALALAADIPAAEVVALYERIGPVVFPIRSAKLRWVRKYTVGWFRSQYQNEALRHGLHDVFKDLTLDDIKARGKFALVAAYNDSSGTPRVFKTDHADELTAHGRYRLCDIALASSAAPTYLPVVELKPPGSSQVERFCDGGLFANTPALIGYAEAVSHLRIPPSEISILSVATPRATQAQRASATESNKRLNRGMWAWRRITEVMIDASSTIASSALERIVGALGNEGQEYVRLTIARPPGLDLDVATANARETLVQLGTECGQDNANRRSVACFFHRD